MLGTPGSSSKFLEFLEIIRQASLARSSGDEAEAARQRKAASHLLTEIYYASLHEYAHRKFFQVLRPGQDTQDIVNDAFVKAFRWIDAGKLVVDPAVPGPALAEGAAGPEISRPIRVRDEREFGAYLQKVVDRLLRDRYARTTRHRVVPLNDRGTEDDPGAEPPSPGPSPSSIVKDQDRLEELRRRAPEIQGSLRPDQWHLFRRFYLDGVPLAEVAAESGLPTPDAARMRLQRIRKSLGDSHGGLESLLPD